jgi:Trypsin-like serine proteases, typically periplasmic, contain C-terminal PDZ domain
MTRHLLAALVAFPAAALFAQDAPPVEPVPASAETIAESLPVADSVVRVNSTNQPWQHSRPWTKRPPYSRRGIGVVIEGGRVLVTAELVANHSYVELERAGSSEKVAADVVHIDYASNLALLVPQDPKFLDGTRPVSLAEGVHVGSRLNVIQLENTGAAALTPAVVTTVTVAPYPGDEAVLLSYRLSVPMQYRDNSFTLPVFLGDRLAGLLMRYDTRSQSADLVPDAVIRNFLARVAKEPYQGFARAGLMFAPTRDPQFRRYLGMNGKSGVYVVSVTHGGAAEKAGLKKGDVILQVENFDIDEDGYYNDPVLGKIPFSHLVSTANLPGGSLKMRVLREGNEIDLALPLEPRDPATVISSPSITDEPPRYYILGGLVLQELSRSYLREWGGDWRSSAPPRLVYLDEFQDELPADRGRIVFISQVLPADTTVGYDGLATIVVEKINGREIKSLEDVAEAVKSPDGRFHKIELESDPGVIFLDAKQVEETADDLQRAYGLPALSNLDKAAP